MKHTVFDDLNAGHSANNLDDLLRAFFRAEMPDPWPSTAACGLAAAPPPAPSFAPRRASLARSRWVLAASVALLLAGYQYLSGRFQDYLPATQPGAIVGTETASVPKPKEKKLGLENEEKADISPKR